MNKIDFVIVSYESVKLADLLIKSIQKYTHPYDYHIYIIDNSDEREMFKKYFGDKFTYISGDNDVDKKGFPSQLSSAHSHGLQTGLKSGNGEYICFLDVDTCFLNEWTKYIIPQLEKYIFVSHRWEESRSIARPQFLITKREYCDKYDIDLSIAYQDSGGIFTKRCKENNLEFSLIPNPCINTIDISSKQGGFIYIYSSLGELVYKGVKTPELPLKILTENYCPGLYYISFYNSEKSSIQKLIKL